MVRKLGGDDDAFISYRTGQYKLHYYETASSLRFVMLTDTAAPSMRNVLHQIYINLWVEYGAFFFLFFSSLPLFTEVEDGWKRGGMSGVVFCKSSYGPSSSWKNLQLMMTLSKCNN